MKTVMGRFLILTALIPAFAAALEPGAFFTKGPVESGQIALSFDDGPGPYTEKILAVLEKHNAKATFFMQGNQVSWRKPLAEKIKAAGHEVASHLWNHVNYKFRLRELEKEMEPSKAEAAVIQELEADMKKTNDQISEVTGVTPQLLRMPHGIDREWVYPSAKKFGLTVVNWSYGADWTGEPVDVMTAGYVRAIKPGGILLFHDGGANRSKTVAVVDAILNEIKNKGLQVTTVGELLDSRTE